MGAETFTWSNEVTLWAGIDPLTGNEALQAQQISPESNVKITIRFYDGVIPNWRVLFGTRVYEINAILNREERNAEMVLLCKEII